MQQPKNNLDHVILMDRMCVHVVEIVSIPQLAADRELDVPFSQQASIQQTPQI